MDFTKFNESASDIELAYEGCRQHLSPWFSKTELHQDLQSLVVESMVYSGILGDERRKELIHLKYRKDPDNMGVQINFLRKIRPEEGNFIDSRTFLRVRAFHHNSMLERRSAEPNRDLLIGSRKDEYFGSAQFRRYLNEHHPNTFREFSEDHAFYCGASHQLLSNGYALLKERVLEDVFDQKKRPCWHTSYFNYDRKYPYLMLYWREFALQDDMAFVLNQD